MKPIEMFVAAFLMASASASAQAISPAMEGPETETRDLGKSVIRGTSRTAEVRKSAFNVNAIDVAKLKEKNVSVNEILNQSSGVAVREE